MNHPTEDEVRALLLHCEDFAVAPVPGTVRVCLSWLALRREADEKLSEGAMIGRLSAGERIMELEAERERTEAALRELTDIVENSDSDSAWWWQDLVQRLGLWRPAKEGT